MLKARLTRLADGSFTKVVINTQALSLVFFFWFKLCCVSYELQKEKGVNTITHKIWHNTDIKYIQTNSDILFFFVVFSFEEFTNIINFLTYTHELILF